jgi:hypothetical protein
MIAVCGAIETSARSAAGRPSQAQSIKSPIVTIEERLNNSISYVFDSFVGLLNGTASKAPK